MRRKALRDGLFPVLLIYGALLLAGCFLFQQRYTDRAVHAPPNADTTLFGGNDWVLWANTDAGVTATWVHPLIPSNPLLKDRYIREGDVLKRLDFMDVYDAEVVNSIVSKVAPGTVMLFQVERPTGSGFAPEWESFFIENSFAPRFTFSQNKTLWSLFPWLIVVGSFLSLIIMLIIFPMVRPAFRENWPLFMVIVLAFVVFLMMGVRHVNLLVRNEYTRLGFEQYFTLMMAVFLPAYGGMSMFSRLKRHWRWVIVLPAAAIAFLVAKVAGVLFSGPFVIYAGLVEDFVLFLFLLHVLTILLISMFQLWAPRSGIDKTFHILSLVYTGPLLLLYLGGLAGWTWLPAPGEVTDFFVYGAILIPLISTAASQLKFGRVSVVLTGSLQYILFAAVSMILYFILHEALHYFGVQFKYQAYLELAIMIVLVMVLRAVYLAYETRFRKYFILAQHSRREQIDRFTSLIPRYTSSKKLLEDLCSELQAYFGTQLVSIRMKDERPVGDDSRAPLDLLEGIYTYLQDNGIYWARNRQMAMSPLPKDMESSLVASPFSLANPIKVNDNIYGMLLLGRKKRGVYNLEDLEIISRIIQQTQLTLGVLHLLEREKLLMQKNYEANLTALRSQINPHFLFNTLNTISALIHDDPDDAEEAVEKLAFIFRYTLKQADRTFVTLDEELSLVQTYLEIEKIRFGERLQLHYDIHANMRDVELPAFVMQTIVENCIKHGIAKIMEQGHIRISAQEIDGFMVCEIEDNGPGIDHSKITTSTGLNNITTRLDKIYELKNLLYFENTGNGTRVTIKIPLNHEQIQGTDRG